MTPTSTPNKQPAPTVNADLAAALSALSHNNRAECLQILRALLQQHPHNLPYLSTIISAVGKTLSTWDDPYASLFADPQFPTPTETEHLCTLLMLQELLCAHVPASPEASTVREQDVASVAPVMLHISSMLYRVGRWDEAEVLLHRILDVWASCGTALPQEAATCWNNLGRIAEERGQLAQGIAWHRKALALRRQLLGEHSDTAFSCGNLGVALASDGQWREAASLLQEAVDRYARLGLSATSEAQGAAGNLAVCRQALRAIENGAARPTY